ncbi:MAG: hypothetical protein JNM68_00625 [Dinghuibacter sp.]|nr:hypothetical protein [Dinghuibacter sp.]
MMKQLTTALLFFLAAQAAMAQNVGINNASPEGALDINGELILRSAELVAANGTTTALDVANNRFSYYRVSGPTANFRIAGITAGVEGRLVTLFNRSGFVMQIGNSDAGALAANRIITGTGADLDIPDRALVSLQYDGAEQRWVVRSHNLATGGGSGGSGWGLTGNSGTGSSNFIGTTDNQPLVIKSFNQTVAEFQFGAPSNNYIGTNFQRTGVGIIGTGAPTHTLEVGLADLAGGSLGAFGIRGTTHMTHFNYGADEHTYIRGGKNNSHVILNDAAGLGNVGIGTGFAPEYKLHLFTTGEQAVKIDGNNSIVAFHDRQSNAQYGFFRVWSNAPFNPAGYYGLEMGVPPIVGADPPKRLMFSTNYSLRMVIMENGNVGIGTTNPTNKLSVNGDIRSREVVVETANWPDYVFQTHYRLTPLNELERFIQQHKHLPNIPAAAELEANGLKLGEVQKKMMEKIEELTLYIIQQQKEIDRLKKFNGINE